MRNYKVKFSIVILNWNGKENLGALFEKCLESVWKTEYEDFEVIFVDNASTDGSYEYAKSNFSHFKFLRNEKNLGSVRARNAGAKFCEGNIVAFLDNDTTVAPNWLDEPAKLFKESETGVVQANLRLLSDPRVPDTIGHCISILGLPVENSFFTNEPQKPAPIFAGKLAALFVRKDIFECVGGFDEDYFFYFEETDLCWRVRLMGYEVYFAPNSIVLHKGSGTFKNGKLLYHRQKNTIASMIKCYELKNLIKYLPLRLIFESGGILYLFIRKPPLAVKNVTALIWVARNIGKLSKERKKIQKNKTIKDKQLFERGFIVKSLKLIFDYTRSRFAKFEGSV
jgi:GT2 family glycosyltransferase